VIAALHDWLVFAHVLAAMVWVGGGVVLAAFAVGVLRSDEPVAVARFVGSLRVVGPAVLAPATVAVLGFGIWLVLDSSVWDFGQTWIVVALVLIAAAIAVGAGHQSRAAVLAQRAVARDDAVEARRQLVRWAWGYAVVVVLLVGIVWDMVFKPGG
jgi:uncharacterized membrane protein